MMKSDKKSKRAGKFLIATAGAFALIGCANSPAHRIAVCEQQGGTETECKAAEFAHEKANPLPVFEGASPDTAAALQAAYDKSANRKKA